MRRNRVDGNDEMEGNGESKMLQSKKKRYKKKKKEIVCKMPSLEETSTCISKDRSIIHTSGRNGNLLDVFIWSEKDNVDELRQQEKKKLINETRKIEGAQRLLEYQL